MEIVGSRQLQSFINRVWRVLTALRERGSVKHSISAARENVWYTTPISAYCTKCGGVVARSPPYSPLLSCRTTTGKNDSVSKHAPTCLT